MLAGKTFVLTGTHFTACHLLDAVRVSESWFLRGCLDQTKPELDAFLDLRHRHLGPHSLLSCNPLPNGIKQLAAAEDARRCKEPFTVFKFVLMKHHSRERRRRARSPR